MTWDPEARVSPHFRWGEFAVSDSHPELVEPVPDEYRPYVVRLAEMEERVREWAGRRVRNWSGYRSPALNTAIGGSPSSQHTKAQAVDHSIETPDGHAVDAHLVEGEFFAMLRAELSLPCGQVIFYPYGRAGTAFIHLALPSERYPEASYFIHAPAEGYSYRRVRSVGAAESVLRVIVQRHAQAAAA